MANDDTFGEVLKWYRARALAEHDDKVFLLPVLSRDPALAKANAARYYRLVGEPDDLPSPDKIIGYRISIPYRSSRREALADGFSSVTAAITYKETLKPLLEKELQLTSFELKKESDGLEIASLQEYRYPSAVHCDIVPRNSASLNLTEENHRQITDVMKKACQEMTDPKTQNGQIAPSTTQPVRGR